MTGLSMHLVFDRPTSPSGPCRPVNGGRLWSLLFLLVAALAACDGESTVSEPSTEPTICGNEPLGPAWYDDAKFGIMIHWGLYSVPAWAETTIDPEALGDPEDPAWLLAPPCPPCPNIENFMRHNPYTELYENSLAIDGTATQEFHRATYGADFPYTAFQPLFEESAENWNPDVWARLFAQAGARYVVFVTKHVDGYLLWPSEVENPHRSDWYWKRDAVGELATAVREHCLRMGVYYNGSANSSFKPPPMIDLDDFLSQWPEGPEYIAYYEAQYRELIARYQPSILWNDSTAPAGSDVTTLLQDYYAAVPEGVVNDRWTIAFSGSQEEPYFRSVEYDVLDENPGYKWEAVRGIGRTFGFNRNQRPEDYGTPEKYIHMLIDVVSKNGNLLLNVGPMADGTIPAEQVTILRAIGAWGALYGEAIFGTRPWTRSAGTTDQGIAVRFTQRRDGSVVYAILLGVPSGPTLTLKAFPEEVASVRLVGSDEPLAWERVGGDVRITMPGTPLPAQSAHAFAVELAAP